MKPTNLYKESEQQYNRNYYRQHKTKLLAAHANWRRANQKRNRARLDELWQRQADPASLRRCSICDIVQVLAGYNFDTAMTDGFDTICRGCRKMIRKG